MKKAFFLMLLLPCFAFSNENQSDFGFGAFFGYGLNFHNADFKRLPDCPSCSPGYQTGFGTGVSLGMAVDYSISNDFSLSSRLLYKNLNGLLLREESTQVIVNGVPQEGVFEHSLDAKLSVIGIEPMVRYNIYDKLKVNIGILLSNLITKDYSQVEKITKPNDFGTFLDEFGNDSQSRERNKFAGTLTEANSIYIAPMFSISYQLPLNKKNDLFIEPEAIFHYGLSDFVNSELVNKWTANNLTLGISIKYQPRNEVEIKNEFKKFYNIDTITINTNDIAKNRISIGQPINEKRTEFVDNINIFTEIYTRTDTLFKVIEFAPNLDLSAVGLDSNGIETPNPTIKVEEFVFNRLDPLLNYIFFDDNSDKIPNRYKLLNSNEIAKFNIDSLYQISTLDMYYNILNIIGQRMKQFPNSRINLAGCNSDIDLEKNNKVLSNNRAESVKKYLVDSWEIKPNRISVKTQNLPDKASTPLNDADKVAENRRVEIYSDDDRIIQPIFIENINLKSNYPSIRFKLNVKDLNSNNINKWQLMVYQDTDNDRLLYNNFGNGNPPEIIDWDLQSNISQISDYENPLKYKLSLTDKYGRNYFTNPAEIKVRNITIRDKRIKKIDDFEIEKFSLILFDFDNSDIVGSNKEIIKTIKSRVKPESIVEIKGLTDRTGDDTYNQILSEKRAQNTKNLLGKTDSKAIGVGEQILQFDNDFPEGRFYSRTVEVTVKNKIKNN